MRHYRKETSIQRKLKRIKREIQTGRLSYDGLAFLQDHQREVLRAGDILLSEWAGIEEETYHEYMHTHEHAN